MLLAAALAAGCQVDVAEEPRLLTVAYPSAVVSLDPHLHNDNHTFSILANVYDGLTAFDAQMALRPALATSWHNPTEVTWRFTLRENVLFHDGRRLTAADVIGSLERARRHPRSVVSSYLVAVESVAEVDPRTIEIRTTKPYPLLANKLTFVAIVPEDAPDEITHSVGTGPFRFSSFDESTTLVLQSFSGAWSGPQPWDEVRFEFEPSPRRRAERWRDDQVDLAMLLDTQAAELLADRSESLVWQDGTAVSFLGFRVDKAPFSDLRVRQGLSLGLDREAIAERLKGAVVPIGQLVSPDVYGHVPDISPSTFDPVVAREVLKAGGLAAGTRLTLDVSARLGPQAHAVAAQLSEIGLDIQVIEQPWKDLYPRLVAGDSHFFLAAYICSAGDASDLFDTVLHTPAPDQGWGGANFMRYSNHRLDQLIEIAGHTLQMPQRLTLFAEAMEVALTDLPLIPLWHSRNLYAVRPGLSWQPRKDNRLLAAEVEPVS